MKNMRTMILTLTLALSACSATQPLLTFTQTDLTNAIAIDNAAAANPNPSISQPAKVKLACDQWVQSNLAMLQAQVATQPQVTGVFSATSAADQVANNVLASLDAAGQASFELGCGPEITHVVGLVSGFKSLQLVAPAAVMVIK